MSTIRDQAAENFRRLLEQEIGACGSPLFILNIDYRAESEAIQKYLVSIVLLTIAKNSEAMELEDRILLDACQKTDEDMGLD